MAGKINSQVAAKSLIAWLNQGPYLAMTMIAAASASVLFAASAIHTMSGAIADQANAESAGEIKLAMTPASRTDYVNAARICSGLTPDIKCDVSNNSLRVIASGASSYVDFMFAISMLQAQDKGFLWSASKLCIGRCDQGVAVAELTASRQRIEIRRNN